MSVNIHIKYVSAVYEYSDLKKVSSHLSLCVQIYIYI